MNIRYFIGILHVFIILSVGYSCKTANKTTHEKTSSLIHIKSDFQNPIVIRKKDTTQNDILIKQELTFEPLKIETKKSNESITDWLIVISSLIGLLISGFGFYYVVQTFRKDIQSRNLNYLAELDKILIEHPELWSFYDEFQQSHELNVEFENGEIQVSKEEFSISNGKDLSIKKHDQSHLYIDGKIQNDYVLESNDIFNIKVDGNITLSNLGNAKISFIGTNKKILDSKIRALIYYKMNHYEVFIKDKKLKEEWKGITKYSMKHSTPFREQLKTMLEERNGNFKGLYLEDTYKAFLETYNEYADNNQKDRIK